MSNHTPIQCWIIYVAPLIFYPRAETVHQTYLQDRNRVLITYNLSTDHCAQLTAFSNSETKEAANKACLDAFLALDRLKSNACSEWRFPECRQLNGYAHPQCSCKISSSNLLGMRSSDVSAFRDCAWKVYAEEILISQTPASSYYFQRTQLKIQNEAEEKSRLRRVGSTSSVAGTSLASESTRAEDTFSGAQNGRASSPQNTSGSPGSSANQISGRPRKRKRLVCDLCGHDYASQKILTYHLKSHELDLRCRHCNQTFSLKGNYTQHLKSFHPNEQDVKEEVPIDPPEAPDGGPYVCDICGKNYDYARSLHTHKKVHVGQARCPLCKLSFSTVHNYRRHKKRRHPEIYENEEEEEKMMRIIKKPFSCETCGASFGFKSSLNQHMAMHRGETTCDQCGKTFTRKTLVNQHKRKEHP